MCMPGKHYAETALGRACTAWVPYHGTGVRDWEKALLLGRTISSVAIGNPHQSGVAESRQPPPPSSALPHVGPRR